MMDLLYWIPPMMIVGPVVSRYMRRHKSIPPRAITLEKVREILTRTDLETNGVDAFFSNEIECDYHLTTEGNQKLSFHATNFWGKLTGEFRPDGRLLQWNDGITNYPRDSDYLREICWHEVWLWESMLAVVLNAKLVSEFGSRGGAHAA